MTPPNLNNYSPTHGLDISQVTSSLDILSSPTSTDHLPHDTMSSCMDNSLDAQLIPPLMDPSSVNGHFGLSAVSTGGNSPLGHRTHNMSVSSNGQHHTTQMRRDNSSPLLINDNERLNNEEQNRHANNYLDSYGHNSRHNSNNLNSNSIMGHLQQTVMTPLQSPHSPHNQNQNQNNNLAQGPITHTHNANRNHPYQRADTPTDSINSNSSNLRSPVEMTLNEYNRASDGSSAADEILRRAPLKIRTSESLTGIATTLSNQSSNHHPPTSSSSSSSSATSYMLNSMHDGDTYRMALKQEPETGY